MSDKLKKIATRFSALPKPIRWGAYSIAGYLSYAALLGGLAPYVAEQQIPKKVSQLIERPVTLGSVSINPFTLQFNLHKFTIHEQDKVFVSLENADLQINFWQSLFNAEIALEYVKLDQPYVSLERFDKHGETAFNFSDILVAIAKNTASEWPQEAMNEPEDRHAPLFPVRVTQARVSAGQVNFLDHATATQLAFPSIDFTLGEFFTRGQMGGQANHYQLKITDIDSASYQLNGQVQLKPLKVEGDIDIDRIQLPRLWGFVEQAFTPELTSGTISVSSNYRLEQSIGEVPTEDALSISSFNGHLALDKVNFNADGKSVVSLASFNVKDIATDVKKEKLDIGAIKSHGLTVSTTLDQDGVDLVTLFTPNIPLASNSATEKTADKESAEADKEGESSWRVKLASLDLNDYKVNISEKFVTEKANQWVIAPINLSTKQIDSDFSQPIDFNFSAAINSKGSVVVDGQADVSKQAVEADVKVNSLKLAQFQPYLATAVNAILTSGELNTQTKLVASTDGQAIALGSAEVSNLSLRDNRLKKPFVKWRSLEVNKFTFDLEQSTLDVDTLTLNQPYARVVINKDRTTNIGDLVLEQSKSNQQQESKAKSSSDAKSFGLKVGKIVFNDGSAFFADNSLTPNFSSGIEQLQGTIGDVSSIPGTKASVDISGSIDRYAPVKVKGEINPLLDKPYLDLDLLFKNVELTTVNPYSGTYAGHYIDKGQLTLALNYQLQNNQLQGSNHVVINQLKLGKASDSDLATDLPIGLAIALLQDSNGVIDLGIDVSGDINDPEFSLGAVIWHTFANVITKAVTAPFSFIAGLVDSDQELNEVNFGFGESSLTLKQQEKLATIGEALAARPMLTLSADGAVDAENDSQALALSKFEALLAGKANLLLEQLPADLSASTMPIQGPLSDALVALYHQAYGQDAEVIRDKIESELESKAIEYSEEELARRWHIALYNFVLNKQQVTEAELGQLAQSRAQAVKAYLVDVVKVDASRVFLLDSRFDIEQDASLVKLSLEAN